MEHLTWLHLSDLHRGQPGEAGRWSAARMAVLDDLRQMAAELGPPDLILFTGDLAFSGKPEEFHLVDETLAEVREATGGDPLLVAVPGNHDLRRPPDGHASAGGFDEYLNPHKAYLRRGLLHGKRESIGFIEELFFAYREFWARTLRPSWDRPGVDYQLGLLPGDFVLTLDRAGLRLGVAGVNSAFLQQRGDPPGAEEHYKGRLVVEPEQLGGVDLFRWTGAHDAALLLMHHPPDWLHNRDLFETNVYHPRWFTACLFGHMHGHRYQQFEGAGPDVRRYIQGSSLFGLEGWGLHRERQELGYAWGRISRTGADAGQLSVWRRRGERADIGGWALGPPAGPYPVEKPIHLRPRKERAGLCAAVVAVTAELGMQRQAVVEQLRRSPQIGRVLEVRAERPEDLDNLAQASLTVVLLGWRTGGTDLLARALEPERDAVLLRFNTAPDPDMAAEELLRAQGLNQVAKARFPDAPRFDGQDVEIVKTRARDQVAAWFSRRGDRVGAERIGLRACERAYLEQMQPTWAQGKQGPLGSMAQADSKRSLDRSKLYVSQIAEPGVCYLTKEGQLVVLPPGKQPPEGDAEPAYIEQALSHPDLPYLVIEGEAGCGKTVLMQHVALVLAQAHLGQPMAAHRLDLAALAGERPMPPVPLLCEAQALARQLPPDAGAGDLLVALRREVQRGSGVEVDEAELSGGLRGGRYLVLIDSLDEVSDPDARVGLARCLEGITNRRDWRSRIVLTTRPSAYTGNGTFGGGLRKLRVARLRRQEMTLMAERYCATFSHSAAYRQQMLAAIDEVAARHGGANLAENPLMLTVTMIVYEAQQRLPDSTADLYHRIVDILCRIRRRREMPPNIRRQVLELVFEGAQRAGTTEWRVDRAAEMLSEKMAGNFRTAVIARDALDSLAGETGLLRFEKRLDEDGRPYVVMRPWHRSFQEYLCASSIAGSAEAVTTVTDRLLGGGDGPSVLEDPFWEGVLRFLVGVYGAQKADRARAYVERLYEHAHGRGGLPAPRRRGRILGLVATGLAEYKEHFGGHRLIEGVRHEVVDAFEEDGANWPMEDRLLALDAVGRLGDPRLSRSLWIDVAGEHGPFQIAFRPVVVADFERFVAAGGYRDGWPDGGLEYDAPENWERQRLHPNCPVFGVSQKEALAFCRWATVYGPWPVQDGWEIDLPTGAELARASKQIGYARLSKSLAMSAMPIGVEEDPSSTQGRLWGMGGVLIELLKDDQRAADPSMESVLGKSAFNIYTELSEKRDLYVGFRLVCRPKSQ